MIEEFFIRPERMTIHRRRCRTRGAGDPMARRRVHLRGAGGDALPAGRGATVAARSVARTPSRWPGPWIDGGRRSAHHPQMQLVIARLTGVIQRVRVGLADADPAAARDRAERRAAGGAVARRASPGALEGRRRAARRLLARIRAGLIGRRDGGASSGRGCRSCSRSSPRISRCRCRPIRRARRPRPGSPANRRPGFRGSRASGSIATAGPSRRCCARCWRPRRCAGSASPRRPGRSSSGSAWTARSGWCADSRRPISRRRLGWPRCSSDCCGWTRSRTAWCARSSSGRRGHRGRRARAVRADRARTREVYPGDPGVLAALLMNRVVLNPNEAIFLPAGNLHAYLRGGGVEVMANSDNVMRGGLTPQAHRHCRADGGGRLHPRLRRADPAAEDGPGIWRYPTPAPEFALWRIERPTPPSRCPRRRPVGSCWSPRDR